MAALTIPDGGVLQSIDENTSLILAAITSEDIRESIGRGIVETLREAAIARRQAEEARKQAEEEQKKRDEQLQATIKPSPLRQKMQRIQDSITNVYNKWIVQNKFFDFLKKQLNTLVDKAGDWLFKILSFLFFLAIFDPQGKFLASILNFITKMAVSLINVLLARLPGILKTMWNLFWNILVPGIARMGKAIGESLFGKDTFLSKIFEVLGGLLPLIIIGAGLFSKLSVALAFFGVTAGATLGWLIAIPLALVAIWKYSDKILEFLDMVPTYLEEKFGVVGKILGAIFEFITTPIYALAYLANYIKEVGIGSIFDSIIDTIEKLPGIIWGGIKSFFGMLGTWFIAWFKSYINLVKKIVMLPITALKFLASYATDIISSIGGVLRTVFSPIIELLGPVLSGIGKTLSFVWDLIKDDVLPIFDFIKKGFNNIMDFFAGIGTFGLKWFFMDDKKKEDFYKAQEVARETGVDLSLANKIAETSNEQEKAELLKSANRQTVQVANKLREQGTEVKDVINEGRVNTLIGTMKNTVVKRNRGKNKG